MALRGGDLKGFVEDVINIDLYKAKMGSDDGITVLSFEVKDKGPAEDLMNFLEKGYDELHAERITEFGQEVYFMDPGTALESIMIKNNYFYGYGDTRRPDSKAIGVNGD